MKVDQEVTEETKEKDGGVEVGRGGIVVKQAA